MVEKIEGKVWLNFKKEREYRRMRKEQRCVIENEMWVIFLLTEKRIEKIP